jgi:ATP/maltotriose-dependent transcriptional regulator MalT
MKVEAGEGLGTGRSHIIKRPRLTRLLDETNARIILLIAPAGYGKTTLAREWLADRPHGWYRGSSASSDPAALVLGLARAAAAVIPGTEERIASRLRATRAPDSELPSLTELLAAELADWPSGAWLVFDDYHFARDSEPAERLVDGLLSATLVQTLIAGRSRPGWARARRLVYGEIYEIGRNLLAMSSEEADRVLTSTGKHTRGGLISLFDGWPALVGLMTAPDSWELPSEAMPDELYSYFADELYQAVSDDLQQSLRRLSLAPTMTSEIARTLIGAKADHVIDQSARLGFFISSADGRVELHPLLRSFLASKFDVARDDPGGQIIPSLVRTLLAREDWDDAFALIERFFDGSLLDELLEKALLRLIDEARLPTLGRWIQTAHEHRLESPIIDFAEAEVSLKQGDLRRAEALGVQAARQLPASHEFTSKALWIAGMSAHLTSREDIALGYFESADQLAHTEPDQRQALWGRFTATNKLDRVSDATVLLDELEGRSGHSADELLRVGTGRLMLASLTGDAQRSLETVDLLAPLVSRARDPWVISSFLNVYAALLTVAGRYSDAVASAGQELELALSHGFGFVIRHAQLQLAAGRLGLRDFRRCTSALRASERSCLESHDEFVRMNVGVLRSRIHMATGSPREAIVALEQYRHPPSTEPMQAEYFAWWSLAHALANNRRDAIEMARMAETMSPRIEVNALVPWTRAVLHVNNDTTAKHTAVDNAYAIALETGNIDAFVSAYRGCPGLLRVLVAEQKSHDQLITFLGQAHDHRLAQTVGLTIPRLPAKGLAILTRREREVLDLVSQGLTNKEIGRTLYIAEGTAKVHVRKICTQLGVRSRTEAAMRAAELGG